MSYSNKNAWVEYTRLAKRYLAQGIAAATVTRDLPGTHGCDGIVRHGRRELRHAGLRLARDQERCSTDTGGDEQLMHGLYAGVTLYDPLIIRSIVSVALASVNAAQVPVPS